MHVKRKRRNLLLGTFLPLLFFSLSLGFLSCTLLCTLFGSCYSRNDIVKRIVDNFNRLYLGRAVKLGSAGKQDNGIMTDYTGRPSASISTFQVREIDVIKTPKRDQRTHLPNFHHIFTKWTYMFSDSSNAYRRDHSLNTVSPIHRPNTVCLPCNSSARSRE